MNGVLNYNFALNQAATQVNEDRKYDNFIRKKAFKT
jgi:hypothetical protein